MNDPRYRYSPSEKRLFLLLSEYPKDTMDIALAFYPVKDRPLFPSETITKILKNLIRKVDANEELFQIVKSPRRGPYTVDYHLAPREIFGAKRNAYIRAMLKAVKTRVDAA